MLDRKGKGFRKKTFHVVLNSRKIMKRKSGTLSTCRGGSWVLHHTKSGRESDRGKKGSRSSIVVKKKKEKEKREGAPRTS